MITYYILLIEIVVVLKEEYSYSWFHRRYFLPRVKIKNCYIEIDRRNFYDQPINDLIKQYDEVIKISIGQKDDDTTDFLLDFAYFKTNYRLIVADLSKQKALGADSRAIQQIIFTDKQMQVQFITFLNNRKKQLLKGRTNFIKEEQKFCN